MSRSWFRWWWCLFLIPMAIGLARLRLDVEILNLLPDIRVVEGLKVYQQHFTNARELIVTVQSGSSDDAKAAARAIAERLRLETNLVAEATWQPPWQEHPEQTAELVASLWLNQPPEAVRQLAASLAETNLASVLAATRDELAVTLSPAEIARLGYDPFGLTRLPEGISGMASGIGQGDEVFASADGTFRLLFVKSRVELGGYRECTAWFDAVKSIVRAALPSPDETAIGYTGRPAFVAEISASMQRDIKLSVGGTAVIIAILFWIAHRRFKPMLWLLTLLAVILAGTLALGGLIFGTINVVSMGFAAILLGLAVDYGVVHYQEALAHPQASVFEIRRAIAPSIFWAALTTIAAFLLLNFGGLPGLAQLGSLVGIGVVLSAAVMIFAFLPPLFRERLRSAPAAAPAASEPRREGPAEPPRARMVFAVSAILIFFSSAALIWKGLPGLDPSADALRPRDSQAYDTLDAIKARLSGEHDPLWVVVAGADESEVARRLDAVKPVLSGAVSNGVLGSFTLPDGIWPRPEFQSINRPVLLGLAQNQEAMRAAAAENGFAPDSLGLTERIFQTWQSAAAATNVHWPSNPLSSWILEKLAAREPGELFAAGFLFPAGASMDLPSFLLLESQLPKENVWLSSWGMLGGMMLKSVTGNLWKLVIPMTVIFFASLLLAFRRLEEVLLSTAVFVLGGLILLAVMRIMGWSWNLLNLMALPLLLGTCIDYSIFVQLALRRHQGDLRLTHRSVGKALLLCGGTAVAGFGSLGLSSNEGMASLGRVCAVGIGVNMLLSVWALPVWWRTLTRQSADAFTSSNISQPSQFYRSGLWRIGLLIGRHLPRSLAAPCVRIAAAIYWRCAPHRREIVIQNLTPLLPDRAVAAVAARRLIAEFALKLIDLWRFESGLPVDQAQDNWHGWERFKAAQARGKGVLLVTAHLGNWEFGGAFFSRNNSPLLVLTQAEPDQKLTELRQASRARWGIETFVVGQDAFAFVEIIKRLQDGATVALLMDRPPSATAVEISLFGQPFRASISAAELARASGCAILPTYVVRHKNGYLAQILPEVGYDRAAIGDRAARIALTQEILRALEPAIRQHPEQWFHFVPVWPSGPKL